MRSLLAANRGKLACIDYEPATNSCASVVSAKLQGNTRRIEVRSRSRVSTG